MKSVALEIKNALDAALCPLAIRSHKNVRQDKVGKEYVVYRVRGVINTSYANDRPVFGRISADVNYYALGGAFEDSRIPLIVRAMEAAGWRLFGGATPLYFLDEADTDGVSLEFIKEGVTADGGL